MEKHAICRAIASSLECEGLVARPVFKTGLRSRRGRGGSIPPHSAVGAFGKVPGAMLSVGKRPPGGECRFGHSTSVTP